METVRDFIFLGSKITADGDCSHEIKRCLLLGRKVMTNLDSILKSRDITFPTKVHLVKAMVFPVVMYGYESWIIKKAEHQRIGAFELRCWRRLLRVSWTTWRTNQSILKESVLNIHWKDWWWSWNSNTLDTWCKELTHLKRPWCWERLEVGGEGDDSMDMSLSKLRELVMERPGVLQSMESHSRTWLSDWTELTWWLIWTSLVLRGKEPAYQSRRSRLDPWVRKIPWKRKWQSALVFLPGKSHRQRILLGLQFLGLQELDMS